MMQPIRLLGVLAGTVGLLGLAVLSNGMGGGPAAQAASTPNTLTYMTHNDSGVVNYDFETTNISNNNVDWPITLVFFNGASVNNIKDALENYYDWESPDKKHTGVTYLGLNHWDEDGGKKTTFCPLANQTANHFRIYGGNSDTIYSQDIGYWVAASTHRDTAECPPPAVSAKFFGTETTEEHIGGLWASAQYAVYDDLVSWNNPEPKRVEGNHTWESNGLVTYIDVTCTVCRRSLP